MKNIIIHINSMIPYILISSLILIIFVFIKYKRKKRINYNHEILKIIFISFFIGILSQAITFHNVKHIGPNSINLIPFRSIINLFNNDFNYIIINLFGNIFLFSIISLFILILWNIGSKNTIIIGFIISFSIEFTQLFINRNVDIDDTILNTLGSFIGVIIYKVLNRYFNFNKFKQK